MSSPAILVVILNYRTGPMTVDAAKAAMTAMEGLNAELVVVDNDSGDGSDMILAEALREDWAQAAPARLIVSQVNGGFGAGNNIGIRADMSDGTRPDYVYLLNSDAFPHPDAIRQLADHLEADPGAGIAGSYIQGTDGEPHMTAFRFPTILGEVEGTIRFGPLSRLLQRYQVPLGVPDETCAVDWLAGASMMLRSDTLDRIGLFDERFFLYFEETDLCLRAARAGYETHYVRASVVEHIGSVSTGMKGWTRVPGYWFDSRWHYFAKNHGRGYAALATAARALAQVVWNIRRVVQRKPRIEPPRFLGSLLLHDLKALFGGGTLPRREAE